MKKTSISLFVAFSSLISTTHAGIVSGTSIIDGVGGDIAITDNVGNAISAGSGFIALGYFSITDGQVDSGLGVSSFSTTLGSFQSITTGNFNDEGLYFLTNDYGKGGLDAQSGRTLYTLIGNESDVNSSDQFILYRHDDVIDADGATASDDSNDMTLNDGSLLFGTVGGAKTIDATNLIADDNYTVSSSFAMTVVPEPSSTALLGLGGLALVLRRRR